MSPLPSKVKFLDQLFHSGHLYYNFVTSYNKEHAPLEDFQLSRQVMGVIGVMHCQQVESMAKGYSTFQEILKRVKADRRRGSLISEWILVRRKAVGIQMALNFTHLLPRF